MKKIFVVVFVLAIAGTAMARPHGPAGCGLGQILFEGKDGLVMNILAATFNSTSGNQTFGMSTGTLGCEDAKTAKVSAVSFIEANQVALSNDISRGEGKTLDAYLRIINKKDAETSVLQANFARIFSEANTPADIHKTIISLIL